MRRFLVRRLVWTVAMLLALSFITFAIFYLLPSADPALIRAGRQPTPELVEQVRRNLGLERWWGYQYAHYLNRLVFHFDLGRSFFNDAPVRDEILKRFPVTLYLALGAAVLWLLIGIPVGVLSALRRGTRLDRAAMGLALFGISAPVHWLGLVCLYLFSRDGQVIRLFPGQGSCLDFHPIRCAPGFVLPWFTLSLSLAAFYARMVRSTLSDTLREDYVRTARAKGVSERRVVFKHAFRGALTPTVSMLGVDVALLAGGAILVETVFNLPGLGRYAFQAIQSSDLVAIQGVVLFGGMLVILSNLVVDLLYPLLDPRVGSSA
ncbi:MAG: ABC transporter permease [Actinomycetota bacterium]